MKLSLYHGLTPKEQYLVMTRSDIVVSMKCEKYFVYSIIPLLRSHLWNHL